MDWGAPGPIGTRDALIEVAPSVGALVRSGQMLAAGRGPLSEVVKNGPGDHASTLAAADAGLADAKRTAGTSITSVVKVLEAMGETRP